MATTTSVVTFTEFEQLPDIAGKRELLHGEVIDLPPARLIHMAIVRELQHLLWQVLSRSRVWGETGYKMRDEYLIPDVSVSYPKQQVINGYPHGAPMLAIEVASAGNTPEQLQSKVTSYLQNGSQEVWVVYTQNPCMMVFHSSGRVERVSGPWTSPATGLTFDIAELIAACLNDAR